MVIEDPARKGGRGAHDSTQLDLTYAEALADAMQRRATEAKLPGNIAYEEMREYRYRRRKEGRLAERGIVEEYGPPNPYKPHRR